jgi:hypothetical protein
VRASPALFATLLPGLGLSATVSELEANALHPYAGIVSSEVKAHPVVPGSPSSQPVHQGTIVVIPEAEDRPSPEKDRWAR